jgi:hypothetical protein
MNGNHLNYFEFLSKSDKKIKSIYTETSSLTFFYFTAKLKICGAKANRDLRNAEKGMIISVPRKLFYKNRDKQITEKTDQLERELTGIPDEDRQPITEFLKTALEDNPENYPQNDYPPNLVDGEPQRDDANVLPEEVFTLFSTFQLKNYYLPVTSLIQNFLSDQFSVSR